MHNANKWKIIALIAAMGFLLAACSDGSGNNDNNDKTKTITVTSEADSGSGTLRQAITDVSANGKIIIGSSVKTIALESRLPTISKNITIEGNGVTITKDGTWTENENSQLMYINGGTVTISRIHFKDGRATDYGAAIRKSGGTLTLESCIFSGNQTTDYGAHGGAIYTIGGTLNVKGCSFYDNKAVTYGGAIFNWSTLNLTGNLFYGNTAERGSVVYNNISSSTNTTSSGYNVVDVILGTGSDKSGWASATGDKTINSIPIIPVNFKLLSGSGAANVITTIPAGYPRTDFYGNTIANGAAAGAVQTTTTSSGYVITLSMNNPEKGSVAVTTPSADEDGLYSGAVTITATMNSGYDFGSWLVDGVDAGTTNPLAITLTKNIQVQAIFAPKIFIVSIYTDAVNSATSEGTLRHALTNVVTGDIIRFGTSKQTIALTRRLPDITKSITIEGNSLTLTKGGTWVEDPISQLMLMSNGTVTMSQIHFKDGRATNNGAAIRKEGGTLTLESCIFSGNQTSANNGVGGAMFNSGTLNVKGCTFYNNKAGSSGGAIYNFSGTLTLTGNLFYGNTAETYPIARPPSSDLITSAGYNVVDVALGTGSDKSGWFDRTGDKTINSLPIAPLSHKLLSSSGAANVITTLPTGYPSVDYYGDTIGNGAAAGAVQSVTASTGFMITLSVNAPQKGSVAITTLPDEDGLYSGEVTIEATVNSGYDFESWLVDGVDAGTTNLLKITPTNHTQVHALFAPDIFMVTLAVDAIYGTEGTLRYAINHAGNGDIIRINTSPKTITLLSRLPTITKNITIEGNGTTLTRTASGGSGTQMMYIEDDVTVTIRQIHFNNGKTTDSGAAIRKTRGTLTVESCIFSENDASSSYSWGGAISNNGGILNVRGCTFYNNKARATGGAIHSNGTVNLIGNLFYGNTGGSAPVINPPFSGAILRSNGYNVVNVPLGTSSNQSGWDAHETDRTFEQLLGSNTTLPFVNTSGFAPLTTGTLHNHITSAPEAFPIKDFNGADRTWPGAPGAVK
jgi:hypothetical protein